MIETPEFQQLWNKRLRLEVWYSCIVASALMAAAQLATIEVDHLILGRPFFALRVPYFFAGLGCLVVLLHQRDKLGFKALRLTMVALSLAVFPYIWISQAAFANSQNPWVPFYGFQITALGIAMFRYSTGVRVNVFLLAGITIEAAAFWWSFHLGSDPLLAQSGYVWSVLLTWLCAVTVLIVQYQYEGTRRRLVELEARAATLEMAARMFVSVRDRANSPLQTLEIGLALLKRQEPESAIVDALLSASKKLVELHDIFNARKSPINWSQAERLADVHWLKENASVGQRSRESKVNFGTETKFRNP
jgi:hypothetical protein